MINLIDDEEWREWSPGYWFSSHGKHASQWTKGQNSHIDPNKWTIANTKPKPDNRKGYKGGYTPNNIYPFKDNPGEIAKHIVEKTIKNGTGFQTTVNPDRIKITILRHRAVMQCFKPLDDYSHEIDISKEECDNTPESSKNFIRRQVYVNHKDHNRSNNHIDNLEWIDSIDNANAKIGDRVKKGDPILFPLQGKNKHYSELTKEQKHRLGHKVKL